MHLPGPQAKLHKEGSSNDDSFEGKCDYCGQKMDTIVAILQDEVTRLTNLDKEAEQNFLISVAGLKQVCVCVCVCVCICVCIC